LAPMFRLLYYLSAGDAIEGWPTPHQYRHHPRRQSRHGARWDHRAAELYRPRRQQARRVLDWCVELGILTVTLWSSHRQFRRRLQKVAGFWRRSRPAQGLACDPATHRRRCGCGPSAAGRMLPERCWRRSAAERRDRGNMMASSSTCHRLWRPPGDSGAVRALLNGMADDDATLAEAVGRSRRRRSPSISTPRAAPIPI